MPSMKRETLLNDLPPVWPEDLLPQIRAHVEKAGVKIVVLDDDPTGTQTVHDVPVLTDASPGALGRAFRDPSPVFFILTNSRSMSAEDAERLNREIAANLKTAAQSAGQDFVVVSRSDSTLRGHYPGEVDWLLDELDMDCDGVILTPFFEEGGRLTVGNVHYVSEGDAVIPAAETEFAADTAFGYQHSDLREWVAEKKGGGFDPDQVAVISLSTIRQGGPDAVAEVLMTLTDAQVCVVNAVVYRDLEVFVAGLLKAEAAGKRFIYRTAASFVRVRAGIASAPLLTAKDLLTGGDRPFGGLVVAGSYVDKTTRQLAALQAAGLAEGIEVSVRRLLSEAGPEDEIQRVSEAANHLLKAGKHVVIFTSREKLDAASQAAFLANGRVISDSLVAIVRRITVTPAWLIAKGGITSSVIATDGLDVKLARVVGQVLPGIPAWRLGEESRFPGRAYVVFPGNVGGDEALAAVVRGFSNRGKFV